jgi:hypothetical protein
MIDKGTAAHPKRAVPGHSHVWRAHDAYTAGSTCKAVKADTAATTRTPWSESDWNGIFARDYLAHACVHAHNEIDRYAHFARLGSFGGAV